jgi:hypothetical protein
MRRSRAASAAPAAAVASAAGERRATPKENLSRAVAHPLERGGAGGRARRSFEKIRLRRIAIDRCGAEPEGDILPKAPPPLEM